METWGNVAHLHFVFVIFSIERKLLLKKTKNSNRPQSSTLGYRLLSSTRDFFIYIYIYKKKLLSVITEVLHKKNSQEPLIYNGSVEDISECVSV